MSNKDRDFYSIKPGFDSKNKEFALIRLFYCNFAQRNTPVSYTHLTLPTIYSV